MNPRVYFIKTDTGHVKIGCVHVRAVEDRMYGLQKLRADNLELIGSRYGGTVEEAWCLAQVKAHKISGEWFSAHPDVLAFIERVLDKSFRWPPDAKMWRDMGRKMPKYYHRLVVRKSRAALYGGSPP